MNWNAGYTKRKQKEMAKKSAAYQQVSENDSYQYTMYNKPQQNTNEWRREQERQHRVKLISVAIITLECIFFISVISYFAVYGV